RLEFWGRGYSWDVDHRYYLLPDVIRRLDVASPLAEIFTVGIRDQLFHIYLLGRHGFRLIKVPVVKFKMTIFIYFELQLGTVDVRDIFGFIIDGIFKH